MNRVNLEFFRALLFVLAIAFSFKALMISSKVLDYLKYGFVISSKSLFIGEAHAIDNNNTSSASQDTQSNREDSKVITEEEWRDSKDFTKLKTNVQSISTALSLNEEEVKLLKQLSERRDKIDKTADAMVLRESMLKLTEKSIAQKLEDLRQLQYKVKYAIDQYASKKDEKMKSLADIYEKMSPKSAAKIFDGMETTMLLKIVPYIKEGKIAPIIASMQINRASELSIALLKERNISIGD